MLFRDIAKSIKSIAGKARSYKKTIPYSPFSIPDSRIYFGVNRTAPSRRMVSPLR